MSDPTRNHPDKIASNNKVIVLKMPSFKFDATKNFLTSTEASSSLSFKPQQFAPVSPQLQQKVQIVQQAPPAPVTVQKITGTPGTILIRAQSSTGKPQFTSVAKVQESPTAQFTTFRSKTSTEQFTMKTQTGQTLLLQPKVFTAPVSSSVKAFTFGSKIPQTSQKVTITSSKPIPKLQVATPKPIPIRPRSEAQTNAQSYATFNSATQKWSIPGVNFQTPVPALTLIQPRPTQIKSSEVQAKVVEISEEIVESFEKNEMSEDEQFTDIEKTPEKQKSYEERRLEVMRIIEGDQDEIAQQIAIISRNKTPEVDEEEEEEASQHDSSSSMLLCDEKIESISPENMEKKEESEKTPEKVEKIENPEVEVVKKKLELENNDKENVEMEESDIEDGEVTIVKVEKQVEIESVKPKRVRKPKNPTIIASLGLPYKPAGAQRKSKVEKKLEFELDFHDPVNKIQWDDGIGGLSNCNKLFGFDEFGLIEVLSKKDAMAKLKDKGVYEGDFNLRKLSDPADQFVCVVCAKLGTIRDFYSPECCSEACLAITKRKSSETREESSESGMTTPIDERKLMFGGEMIPLQQLQQQLLEKQLPLSKRQRSRKRPSPPQPEAKFQWDTYLTAKSVPAPVSLFKSPYPRSPNPFKVGMKLEAVDPQNQRHFCVCTVEEKLGYRIKLHFDGFPSCYDFWVNADSPNIFPAGFCQSTSRSFQTPPKWSSKKFDWSEYLDFTNSIGAQRAMFPRLEKKFDGNPFEEGMRLEVMWRGNLYVGNIVDVLENRVLVDFNERYEWFDIHSPLLHPCNYHKTVADPSVFVPPFRPFDWKEYLKGTGFKEAPAEFLFFRTRSVFDFESGMKLEVVDAVNRQLIRPATILSREEYKIHVLFDGFDIAFAFWLDDDSEDIHPINWSEKTGHPIEHPAGFSKSSDNGLCPTAGCRGIGNGSHSDRYFHDNEDECPYNKNNWEKLMVKELPSRIEIKSGAKRSLKLPPSSDLPLVVPNNASQLKQEVPEYEDISYDVTPDDESSSEVKKPKQRGRKRKSAPEAPEDTSKRIKVSKAFIEDYGPQLNYSFNLWKRNSKVLARATIDDAITDNPSQWSVENVHDYVNSITDDLDIAGKFQEQEIDGEAFICLCQNDLTQLMGIRMGPAIKIYNRILHLREEVQLKFTKL